MLYFEHMQISKMSRCNKISIASPDPLHFKPRHKHAFVIFLSGRFKYIYPDNNIFCGEPNSFVYLPQGVAYEVDPMEPAVILTVNFYTINNLKAEAFAAQFRNLPKIRDCMFSIVNSYNGKKLGYEAEIKSLLYKVIYLIQQNQTSEYIPTKLINKLNPAIEYIEKHYLDIDTIKISELADKCYISEKYFTTLFSRYYKESAKQYILQKKIEYAKAMLESTSAPITDISEICGFTSVYYFSKLFKQRTGITPTEYRKINIY